MTELLWGLEHDEVLDPCEGEVIRRHLDATEVEDWPETLTLYAHRHEMVRQYASRAELLAERLIEELSERYGHSDPGEWVQPTAEDVADMSAAVNSIISRFRVWTCKPTGETYVGSTCATG